MTNVFLQIINGDIPCDKVFENERIIAFKDIAPAAPVHILIVPKKPISNISAISEEDGPLVAEMVMVANQLAKKFNLKDGYRLLTNNGPHAGQAVYQLHFHLLGGTHLGPIG
jgi:histidine triad (HIT) family protein